MNVKLSFSRVKNSKRLFSFNVRIDYEYSIICASGTILVSSLCLMAHAVFTFKNWVSNSDLTYSHLISLKKMNYNPLSKIWII